MNWAAFIACAVFIALVCVWALVPESWTERLARCVDRLLVWEEPESRMPEAAGFTEAELDEIERIRGGLAGLEAMALQLDEIVGLPETSDPEMAL